MCLLLFLHCLLLFLLWLCQQSCSMCLSVCLLACQHGMYLSVCMPRSDVDAPSLPPRARYLDCPTGDLLKDGVENCCAVTNLPLSPVMFACLFSTSPVAMLISTSLYFRLRPPPPPSHTHKNLLLLFPAKVSTFPPASDGKALKFCHVRKECSFHLSCLVLSCLVLSCLALSCLVLSYPFLC
jgi:hypothetical protein